MQCCTDKLILAEFGQVSEAVSHLHIALLDVTVLMYIMNH